MGQLSPLCFLGNNSCSGQFRSMLTRMLAHVQPNFWPFNTNLWWSPLSVLTVAFTVSNPVAESFFSNFGHGAVQGRTSVFTLCGGHGGRPFFYPPRLPGVSVQKAQPLAPTALCPLPTPDGPVQLSCCPRPACSVAGPSYPKIT